MSDEIRDKDGWTIYTVERHHGGVALISDSYGNKLRTWLTPHDAKRLGQLLVAKAEEPQPQ